MENQALCGKGIIVSRIFTRKYSQDNYCQNKIGNSRDLILSHKLIQKQLQYYFCLNVLVFLYRIGHLYNSVTVKILSLNSNWYRPINGLCQVFYQLLLFKIFSFLNLGSPWTTWASRTTRTKGYSLFYLFLFTTINAGNCLQTNVSQV